MDYITDLINPVNESIVEFTNSLPKGSLGVTVQFIQHNQQVEIQSNSIAIIGLPEDRRALNNEGAGKNIDTIRKELYQLFIGNWSVSIYDLGDLIIGKTYQDTEVAVQEVVTNLLKQKIIPILIGGSQSLTYAAYRAYDNLEQKVNLAVVDAKFDLGAIGNIIDSQSYLTKIVMEKPNNLINFTNIGYQTFLNSQEEINLLDTLLFESYRLGDVKNEINIVEPVLRETDLLSIDIGAVRRIDAPANGNTQISGLQADDICKITRYAGLSDRVSLLGIFEYNEQFDKATQTGQLIAQMIWYFIEGVNYRSYEFPSLDLKNFKKYIVMIDEEAFQFYKSDTSGRWWMEISLKDNNKTKRRTLIPCTYNDYLTASQQQIPKRWLVNRRKLG